MREARPRQNFLKSIDVGRRLGIGADRVRQLARDGQLKPAVVLPGGQRLFTTSAVEELIDRRERLARARGVRGEVEPPADTA
jgi:hypothetical protein